MSLFSALVSAVGRANVREVEWVIDDWDVDVSDLLRSSALCACARTGYRDSLEVCALLLDRARALGAESKVVNARNADGDTALCVAAWHGLKDMCALLLDRGATHAPDKSGMTPLARAACGRGGKDVCALLLDRGATHAADETGTSPLGHAAMRGHKDVCALLLDRGATQAPNKEGATPLSEAASRGHADVCALLVARARRDSLRSGAKRVLG